MLNESSTSSRTYRLKTSYRLIGLGVIAVGLALDLLLATAFQNKDRSAADAGTYVFLLVSCIALFDLLAWVGAAMLRVRLVASSRGVIFYALGYSIRSRLAEHRQPE